MTSLTQWLLRAFADNWPGGLPQDGDQWGPLLLEDRDESAIVDPDTAQSPTALEYRHPSQTHDLTQGNVLGVALTDYPQEPAGLGGTEYSAEPVLSVLVEGAPARKHGHVDDAEDFEALVLAAVKVVQNIDNGTIQAAPVDFHVAEPGLQTPNMSGWKDRYEWSFETEASGYRSI